MAYGSLKIDTLITATKSVAIDSLVGSGDLSSATNSTSTTTGANSAAVKAAYDLANAAMPKSGGTFTSDISLAGQASVRFFDADSSHWVAFRAPATVTSNLTWTLPATNGAGALTNDGSGTLSWSSSGVSLGLAVALG